MFSVKKKKQMKENNFNAHLAFLILLCSTYITYQGKILIEGKYTVFVELNVWLRIKHIVL